MFKAQTRRGIVPPIASIPKAAEGTERRSTLLKVALAILATLVVFWVLFRYSGEVRANVAERDSLAYWAAAKLLLHHQDPYSSTAVLAMERRAGYRHDQPLVLRTPPWSLFMVLPLGVLGPFWAWVFWTVISFTSFFFSMRLCWRIYGNASISRTAFVLVGYLFAPVLACLIAGQMGFLLLLGVVLFLLWQRSHPFMAGAALVLPFAKPHLLAVFWLGLLVRLVSGKLRRVILGFVVALAVAALIPLVFNPSVFADYVSMLRRAAIGSEFIPALSGVLRLLFFRNLFWAQFVPLALGSAWSLWYVAHSWETWCWSKHGCSLLAVSVLLTPYAWLTDEVVLLPAILLGCSIAYQIRNSLSLIQRAVLTGIGLLNLLLLLILKAKIPFATGIYFWSSLVWFCWYFYLNRLSQKHMLSGDIRERVSG